MERRLLSRVHSVPVPLLLVVGIVAFLSANAQPKKPLTFTDAMKFPSLESPVISEDGAWVAWALQPDRGDGKAFVQSTRSSANFTVERGGSPAFSRDGRWVAIVVKPRAAETEGKKVDQDKQKPGLTLLNTENGDTLSFRRINRFAFSPDARWIALLNYAPEEKQDSCKKPAKPKNDHAGSELVLRELSTGKEWRVPSVITFAFDTTARFIAYAVGDSSRKENGLSCRDLRTEPSRERSLANGERLLCTNLAWSRSGSCLAWVSATLDDKDQPGPATLWLWKEGTDVATAITSSGDGPKGWMIPSKNDLVWSRDGQRLFFGFHPDDSISAKSADSTADRVSAETDLFDVDTILKTRGVNVWHWNDPRIIPSQKKRWKDAKDQLFRGVYHLDSKGVVLLADSAMPYLTVADSRRTLLGRSDVPYLKEVTWDGEYVDAYAVDVRNGSRMKFASRLKGGADLSPDGGYAIYYRDGNWFLYDVDHATTRNLTGRLGVPFANEDHDTPSPPPGYGIAGWVEGDRAVLIYDKYDVWELFTGEEKAIPLTGGDGRRRSVSFRVQRLDPDQRFFRDGERLLLTGYNDRLKRTGVYAAAVGSRGVDSLAGGEKKYGLIARAKRSEKVLFTRQSYEEFPDLWVGPSDFSKPRKVTDACPQIAEFAWGSAELVEWKSADGKPLQGVLIKPGNYQPGKRYPVLVYYYERSSQQLYDFPRVAVNHRPCLPLYASNGYAVFLPDIRYEVGHPGRSAVRCLVPGVRKLIDIGVADPKAVALHGHSWSGYQTAFVITQTPMFAAAIAGAPVGNMTSAYSGIRLESGLARQFLYEQDQSRIGGSLWQKRDLFIENSPVFFADRITTPLLIEFGDEDDAVPWSQGVELYLAMRRLGKDCVMLQYRGEPHHLKQYPNKLDYAVRMKEYLDHYLKGTPAPEWISRGIPYSE
jgi:dipeptidyl aminopeptidase/acylaminoacyl peptidase